MAASFIAAAENWFLFHIKTTRVKIAQSNIWWEHQGDVGPDCGHLLPATRKAVGGIRTLIVKKEAILEEQQDTLSELEQGLNELMDKEVLGGSGEGTIHPTFCKLQTSGEDATLAGGLDNVALGSFSVVNGGEGNRAIGTSSSVVGGALNNLSAGTNSTAKNSIVKGPGNYVGGGKKNFFSQTKGSYATILGGLNNLVDGNYAIAMGQNAQVLSNNSMAIGLEPNSSRYAYVTQQGDFLIRS